LIAKHCGHSFSIVSGPGVEYAGMDYGKSARINGRTCVKIPDGLQGGIVPLNYYIFWSGCRGSGCDNKKANPCTHEKQVVCEIHLGKRHILLPWESLFCVITGNRSIYITEPKSRYNVDEVQGVV